MEVDDQFPKEKLHEMVEKLSNLTPGQRIEIWAEMMGELEKDVQKRRQPPLNWNVVLNRLFDLADRYLDIKRV